MVFVESRTFITDTADCWKFKTKCKRQAEVRIMLSVSSHFFRSLNRRKCKREWLCSKNESYSYMVNMQWIQKAKATEGSSGKPPCLFTWGMREVGIENIVTKITAISSRSSFRFCRQLSLHNHTSYPPCFPGLQQRWSSSNYFAAVSPYSHNSLWKLAFHVATTENIIF